MAQGQQEGSLSTARSLPLIKRSLSRFSAAGPMSKKTSSNSLREFLFKNSNGNRKQNKSRRTIKKKSLSFSKNVEIVPSLTLDDYTDEELEASFYNRSDYQKINRDIRFTLDLIEDGLPIEGIEFCRRGIEWKTREGNALRTENRTMSLLAVLSEQDSQWQQQHQENQGGNATWRVPADEAIADVYSRQVIESVSLAIMAGRLDEKEAGVKKSSVKTQGIDTSSSSDGATTRNQLNLFEQRLNKQRTRHFLGTTAAR